MKDLRKLVEKLCEKHILTNDEFVFLLENRNDIKDFLFEKSRKVCLENFGNGVYIRGLVEISSYCKNDCFYCGIRRSSKSAERYRLDFEDIVDCCKKGYKLGFRTFVFQGGEDLFYTDEFLCRLISTVKKMFPDCAVTLSLGERSYESYLKLFESGADRYLLRHETADESLYSKIHPKEMSFENRMECLQNLKKIGYQTGAGFMVGVPFQTLENIADDLLFLANFKPEMVGIGPFMSAKDTPFENEKDANTELTLFVIALVRLILPFANIPATTALATADKSGSAQGFLAGANVTMPNLSPQNVRKKYSLYDNKKSTFTQSADGLQILQKELEKIGRTINYSKGDYREF